MIKVKANKKYIEVSGHAKYDDYGKDIVCASVSSIVITSINAILKYNDTIIKYEEKEGFISIDILKEDKISNIILNNMLDMLEELEKDYPNNIKINKEV